MKKFFDDTVEYFKDLTKTGKILWIIVAVVILILLIDILVLIINVNKNKKKIYLDNFTKGKNYNYFTKKMDKKYKAKDYILAILNYKDCNKLKEDYNRALYKQILVGYNKVLKDTLPKKSIFARTNYNEYVIAIKKNKKIDLLSLVNNITNGIDNLIVNKSILQTDYCLGISECLTEPYKVELNRIVIKINQSCDKICYVSVSDIALNKEYLALNSTINDDIKNDALDLSFIPLIDIEYAKIKFTLCGLKGNNYTSFDSVFTQAVINNNLTLEVTKLILTKLSNLYKPELNIGFILPIFSHLADNDLEKLVYLLNESVIPNDLFILGFLNSDYINNPNTKHYLSYFKEKNFKTAILDEDNNLNYKFTLNQDLIMINDTFIKENDNLDKISSYCSYFSNGTAFKAIEINNLNDINLIKDTKIHALIYSKSYFKYLGFDDLLTFVRINQIFDDDEFIHKLEASYNQKYLEALSKLQTTVYVEKPVEKPEIKPITEEKETEQVPELVEEETIEEDDNEEASLSENTTKFPAIIAKPFPVRLNAAKDEVKSYYVELNKKLSSFKHVKHYVAKNGESFRYKNRTCAVIRIVGKTLRVYLDLNPDAYPITRFHQKNVSDLKRYVKTPMMVKVKSHTGLKKACVLIEDMARIYDMEAIEAEKIDYLKEVKNWIKIYQ